jgi:hypothetical protein
VTVTGKQFTNGAGTFEMFGVQLDNATPTPVILQTGDTIKPLTSVSAGETAAFGDSTDRKFMLSNVLRTVATSSTTVSPTRVRHRSTRPRISRRSAAGSVRRCPPG